MASQLQVAVLALDALRRHALSQLVAEAGHLVVGTESEADVVISDGDRPAGETRATVALGGTEDDVAGMLSRHPTARQLDAALRAVAAGLMVRSPEAAESGFGRLRESCGQTLLTPREHDVLAALAEGLTNKAIARRLTISLHTVKFHVESLFRKLDARTRTEAVMKAAERRRRETITL